MLSKKTDCALKLMTKGLIELARCHTSELHRNDLLPGTFHTDILEAKFSNFQVGNILDRFEWEKKIRNHSDIDVSH